MGKKSKKVGVIVGKFQVPSLHAGHKYLIQTVLDRHETVIVMVGTRAINPTKNLPLSFTDRKNMILDEYNNRPGLIVWEIKDVGNPPLWSSIVDQKVISKFGPRKNAIMYGSRDSFIQTYSGKYPTVTLKPFGTGPGFSGTQVREQVGKEKIDSHDFRAGQIHANHIRYPHTYPTVDVAIVDNIDAPIKLLLGRKPTESKFRFPGGFDEPGSDSYEATAIKEAEEETGCLIHSLQYITSCLTTDWRYRNEVDKIKTLFYVAQTDEKYPQPGDDICELKWVNLKTLNVDFIKDHIIRGHHGLLKSFLIKYNLKPEGSVIMNNELSWFTNEIKKDEKKSVNHS